MTSLLELFHRARADALEASYSTIVLNSHNKLASCRVGEGDDGLCKVSDFDASALAIKVMILVRAA